MIVDLGQPLRLPGRQVDDVYGGGGHVAGVEPSPVADQVPHSTSRAEQGRLLPGAKVDPRELAVFVARHIEGSAVWRRVEPARSVHGGDDFAHAPRR
jgi:hypothetical protein